MRSSPDHVRGCRRSSFPRTQDEDGSDLEGFIVADGEGEEEVFSSEEKKSKRRCVPLMYLITSKCVTGQHYLAKFT